MAYAPKNSQIFNAAFTGALAGIGVVDRFITDSSPTAYAGLVSIVGAYAQAIDTAWTAGRATSQLDVMAVQCASAAYWQDRSPTDIDPAAYSVTSAALIAMITESETYYSGNAIFPPQISSLYDGYASNLAALAQYGQANFSNGARVLVLTLEQEFQLDIASTVVPDGITVIAAVGGGNWLRKLTHVPKWTALRTWYLDPQNVAASDEGDGSATGPLKTTAEIARRLRVVDMTAYTINLLSDQIANDTFDFCPEVSGTGTATTATITIIGQRTLIANGVVVNNGVTTFGTNPATNQQASIDAGFSWATHVGHHVKITSGAMAGYECKVDSDLGGNAARMSNFWLPGTAPANNGTFAAAGNGASGAPQNGDTIEVYSLTNINGNMRHAGNPLRVEVRYKDVTWSAVSSFNVEGVQVQMIGCGLLGPLISRQGWNSNVRLFNCYVAPSDSHIVGFDGRIRLIGGTVSGASMSVYYHARFEFINTIIHSGSGNQGLRIGIGYNGLTSMTAQIGGQAGIFTAGNASFPGGNFGLGIFDVAAGAAVKVARGGKFSIDAPLYGSDNQYGVDVEDGGEVYLLTGTTVSIAATAQQLRLNGGATAIPPLVAGTAVPAASALTTFAHLAAAPFNGNVLDYGTGSKIITVASQAA